VRITLTSCSRLLVDRQVAERLDPMRRRKQQDRVDARRQRRDRREERRRAPDVAAGVGLAVVDFVPGTDDAVMCRAADREDAVYEVGMAMQPSGRRTVSGSPSAAATACTSPMPTAAT
jgi:hypothetical protein